MSDAASTLSVVSALPLNYVSRRGWGAKPPAGKPTILLASRVDTIVYHYTAAGTDERDNHAECASRVRGIQSFHQNTRGWNDIAYNYLVCKHGYIYEGRGIANKSAATGIHNSHTLAVCFLGDDTVGRDDVTVKGRQALVEISRWIRQQRLAVNAYAGHRDFMSTSCPGNELYSYIHSRVFAAQVAADEKARLRRQILSWRAEGWGWERIKATQTWKRFTAIGGK
jgi:hypothetical protein